MNDLAAAVWLCIGGAELKKRVGFMALGSFWNLGLYSEGFWVLRCFGATRRLPVLAWINGPYKEKYNVVGTLTDHFCLKKLMIQPETRSACQESGSLLWMSDKSGEVKRMEARCSSLVTTVEC